MIIELMLIIKTIASVDMILLYTMLRDLGYKSVKCGLYNIKLWSLYCVDGRVPVLSCSVWIKDVKEKIYNFGRISYSQKNSENFD